MDELTVPGWDVQGWAVVVENPAAFKAVRGADVLTLFCDRAPGVRVHEGTSYSLERWKILLNGLPVAFARSVDHVHTKLTALMNNL